jgi:putative aldouronate transport system substrate-binding protein
MLGQKYPRVLLILMLLLVVSTQFSLVQAQEVRPECTMDWTPTFPEFEAYDPPIRITTPFPAAATFIGDDTFTDNPMYNRVLNQLGIQYDIAWQSSDNTQLQTAIASGNLPDVFPAGGTGGEATATLSLLIENGAVADITDIWEETASDLTKEMKGYPDADMWTSVTRDGRIYGIAFTYGPAYNIDNLGFIRQDWLDQLGLPMPTTIDELETTMRAFVDAGLARFGVNANSRLVTWYMSLDPIFGAYGSMPRTWLEAEDGTLVYGSIQPGVRDALARLNQWYVDGLLNPDFFTYSQGDSAAFVMSEEVGVWFAPWWSAGTITVPLTEQNPDARIALLPPLTGPDGHVGRKASPTTGAAVVFRADVDPEIIRAVIRQLNWQIDMHVNWEEYQQYGEWSNSNAFEQGYEWIFDENCEMARGPVDNSYVYVDGVGMGFPHITYPSYQGDIFADMAAWLEQDPAGLNSAQRYLLSNKLALVQIEYYNTVVNTLDLTYVDRYLGANTERMTALLPDLLTMEDTVFIEMITGARPVADFDQFVADWLASGGSEVIEDVNTWYASR